MISACNCAHAYQDKIYGLGLRLHTQSQKAGQAGIYFCTVCSTKKNLAATPTGKGKDEKKKKK